MLQLLSPVWHRIKKAAPGVSDVKLQRPAEAF